MFPLNILLSPNWHTLVCSYHSNFTQRDVASQVLNVFGNISSFCRDEEVGKELNPLVGSLHGQGWWLCLSNAATDLGLHGVQAEKYWIFLAFKVNLPFGEGKLIKHHFLWGGITITKLFTENNQPFFLKMWPWKILFFREVIHILRYFICFYYHFIWKAGHVVI